MTDRKRRGYCILVYGIVVSLLFFQMAYSGYGQQHEIQVSNHSLNQHESPSSIPEGKQAGAEKPHFGVHLTLMHWAGRILNTAGLLFILYYLIFKMGRVPDSLAKKRKELENSIEEAKEQIEHARIQLKNVQKKMAELESRIKALLDEAEKEAEEEERKLIEQSRVEVERLKRMAQDEIERAHTFARAELQKYTAELAIQLSENILKKELTEKEQEKLLYEALQRFQNQFKERQT